MMLEDWFTHTVTITPKTGEGAYGPVYGTEYTQACLIDETTRLIRDRDGQEKVSSGSLYLPEDAARPPEGSKIMLGPPFERESIILATAVHTSALGTPNHVEVNLL